MEKTEKFTKEKILAQLKKPAIYIPLLFIVIVLPVIGSQIYRFARAKNSEALAGTNTTKGAFGFLKPIDSAKLVVSPLDGERYPEDVANRHTLGVMIENHPDSRPQFGLTDASVVYEAIAEGGITRFLALYGPKIPDKAGPVRSARTYYLDWCLEYDCFYGHVGGNIDALDLIPKIGIKDLDQFRLGTKAYFRQPRKGIATEHTMYTTPSKLYAIAGERGWNQTGGQPAISYKQDIGTKNRPASQSVAVDISSKQFNTSWSYDPTTNAYTRSMGGVAHKDGKTGEQIKSKVLIVQEVVSRPTTTRINEHGFIFDTIGTGKAKIIQDGVVTEATWKKSSQKNRTIFTDVSGDEIKMNTGQRWITVVNPGTKVTVAAQTATPSPSITK